MSPDTAAVQTVSGLAPVLPAFVATNTQDWPARAPTSGGDGSAPPAFGLGAASSHDCGVCNWGNSHPALNTADWTKLDAFVSGWQAVGVTSGLFVWENTPTFLAQVADQSFNCPYGPNGGGSYPTDLTQATWFAQQFGIRNRTVWGGFFKWVQLWNEPEANNFAGTRVGQCWMTRKQFINVIASGRAGFLAGDPSLTMLSAGTYDPACLSGWMGETGDAGAGVGVMGWQCFEEVAAHPYWATPNTTYTGHGDPGTLGLGGVANIKSVLTAYGVGNRGVRCTEWGVESGGSRGSPGVTTQAFLNATAVYRRQYICRLLMAAHRLGILGWFFFSYGGPFLSGDLVQDTAGVVAGINDFWANAVNRTRVAAGYYPDGREWMRFSDGSTWIV